MKAQMIIFLEGKSEDITFFYQKWENIIKNESFLVSNIKIHYERKD